MTAKPARREATLRQTKTLLDVIAPAFEPDPLAPVLLRPCPPASDVPVGSIRRLNGALHEFYAAALAAEDARLLRDHQ